MPIGVVKEESPSCGCWEVYDLERTFVILVVRLVKIDSFWGLSCSISLVDSSMESRPFECFFWSQDGLSRDPRNLRFNTMLTLEVCLYCFLYSS